MSSDPRSVEDALHETAVFPGNFNPQTGRWEKTTDGRSAAPRTKLVFDRETKKLLAMRREQVMDTALAIDIAAAGVFVGRRSR